MIVIHKKRIVFILSCFIFSICAFYLFQSSRSLLQTSDETTQTTSLPVSNKVIVLDAGHGTPDERSTKFKRNNRSPNKFKNSI